MPTCNCKNDTYCVGWGVKLYSLTQRQRLMLLRITLEQSRLANVAGGRHNVSWAVDRLRPTPRPSSRLTSNSNSTTWVGCDSNKLAFQRVFAPLSAAAVLAPCLQLWLCAGRQAGGRPTDRRRSSCGDTGMQRNCSDVQVSGNKSRDMAAENFISFLSSTARHCSTPLTPGRFSSQI